MADPAQPVLAPPRTFTVRTVGSVPPDTGVDCSLALDASNLPMVSCWRNPGAPDAELLLITGFGSLAPPRAITFGSERIVKVRGSGSAIAIERKTVPGPLGPRTISKPWVAYYDVERGAVNAARREDTGWVIETVDGGVSNFAVAGIGLTLARDGTPCVCYSSGRGVTFATRVAPAGAWQRDALAGSRWERHVIADGRLTAGFDLGVVSSGGSTDWLSEDVDSLKMQYPSGQQSGAVAVTFGPVSPLGSRAGMNVTAYSSLVVEMRGDAGKRVEIGIKDRTQPDTGAEAKVRVTLTADWSTHIIPLAKFAGANHGAIYFAVEFVFSGLEAVTAFVRTAHYSDDAVPDTTVNRLEAASAPPPRELLSGARLAPGFDLGVGTSGGVNNFAVADGNALRIAYPAGQSFGFVTLHPIGANRPGLDLSAFSTVEIEMRGDAGRTVLIGIKDRTQPDDGSEKKIPIRLTADFRTYAFPLTLFRLSGQTPDLRQVFVAAEFVFSGAQAVTLSVRSVRYTSSLAVPGPSGTAVLHSSLALDPRDTPWISYFDQDIQKLRVATKVELFQVPASGDPAPRSVWRVIEIGSPPEERFAGEFTSIKADSAGRVHFAYWSLSGPRYARIDGPGPVKVESIDPDPASGHYVSLALNRAGDPEVAYYDAANGRLKLARRIGGRWFPEIVDDPASGDAGGYASLALNPADRPTVAYYDWQARQLRIAVA